MPNSNNDIITKTKQEKLDYLNSFQYPILLEQKNKKFCLIIPELSLIAIHDDLETAYKELCAKKEKLFNDVLESGTEDTINLPRKTSQRYEMFNQLKIFVYKALIICLLAGVLFVFGVAEIKDRIPTMDTVKNIGWGLILEAEKFTNEPEDIKQKRIERLHDILNGLRPFIREFQAASKDLPDKNK